jgi:hypothetical protein
MSSGKPAAKLAIIVDSALAPGLAANTAAVLALTIGRHVESLIGSSLKDGDGRAHAGITNTPVPILTASAAALKEIRNSATAAESGDLLVVDFTDCAQRSRTYDDYAGLLATSTNETINYLGVGLHGPAKSVNRITGSLPLFR